MDINNQLFQEWHVLVLESGKPDKTLKRALNHTAKKEKRIGSTIFDYQKSQLLSATNICKNFRNSIDIGAHYGLMSYHMSNIFNKVYSFEIHSDIRKCLEMNMKKFNCNNVEIYPYGAGDTSKKVGLITPISKTGGPNTFGVHVDEDAEPVAEVRAIDSFNFTDIDFIKIDAEGYEPLIIDGAMKTIEKYKPIILYERKGHERRYGHDRFSVLKKLSELGYRDLGNAGNKNGIIGIK
jgi:FkbM family methyltransferase